MVVKPYLIVSAAFLAITGVMIALEPTLGPAAIALVYLFLVFVSALMWGRWPSRVASLLAFLGLNFLFATPYTLLVTSVQEALSLVVFLGVAEATNVLVLRLREQEIERLRLQREAAETETLRRTDELKTALLSAVSHELRNPLAAIRMTTAALMKPDARWSEVDRLEMLESIDSASARLSRLVSNLLDLSRLEGGVLQPVKQWCDLGEVVSSAVDHLRAFPGETHAIEVNFPPDLPLVPLDFVQIQDVILNLLENAARYSLEGTPIRITVRRQDGAAVVEVMNEGPAIPLEAAGRIFDRFYTLPGSRGLTGLGLAICKGLVEGHGGRIWVEAPGAPGARFAFALPLGETPADVGELPQKAMP